jgi:hypothetical protein
MLRMISLELTALRALVRLSVRLSISAAIIRKLSICNFFFRRKNFMILIVLKSMALVYFSGPEFHLAKFW